MTQKRRVAPEKSGRRQAFSPAVNRPCYFFKIILPSTIQQKKMMLPVKFVRKYGDELCGNVTLNGPDGRSWQVGLEKVENDIWVHNGWNEFVEFYSIQDSYLLLFRYIGKMNLNVIIFDMTACEISYPRNDEIPENTKEGLEDDDSVEILYSTLSKAKGKHGFPIKVKLEKEVFDTKTSSTSKRRRATLQERERANNASKMFKSENPSFRTIMRPYNIRNYVMYVPRPFSKKYMDARRGAYDIKLQLSDGRQWPVRFIGSRNSILSKGWSVFATENKLEEGDVCVFEKIKIADVMKVSIFRAREHAENQ